jgi:hypothetical protein
VTVYPASLRKADKVSGVWLPVPAVGLWIRRACIVRQRPLTYLETGLIWERLGGKKRYFSKPFG